MNTAEKIDSKANYPRLFLDLGFTTIKPIDHGFDAQ